MLSQKITLTLKYYGTLLPCRGSIICLDVWSMHWNEPGIAKQKKIITLGRGAIAEYERRGLCFSRPNGCVCQTKGCIAMWTNCQVGMQPSNWIGALAGCLHWVPTVPLSSKGSYPTSSRSSRGLLLDMPAMETVTFCKTSMCCSVTELWIFQKNYRTAVEPHVG